MERQGNRIGDHAVYCVAGIAMLGLLSYLALKSPMVIHKLELPILSVQSKIFGACLFDEDFEKENRRISRIISIMDREVEKRRGYRTINTHALRGAVRKASVKTTLAARYTAVIFFIAAGSLMIVSAVRARDMLHDRRENIRVSGAAGVEGFIRIVGGYLTGDVISTVRRSPTPGNLCDAFRTARQCVNIPCCAVGRLFPKGSAQRLALLGFGKTKVTFAREKDAGGPDAVKTDH